jgi:phosphoglycolate phosphatase
MILKEIADYHDITIQCHDIPDADAIASGFALMRYLESEGASVRLIYGGKNVVTKANLKWMLELLRIPLEHVTEMPRCGLLVTVDCQYGAGNLQRFETDEFAVFDHHRPEIPEGPRVVIRPALGSCSTLIWDLMRKEGFDFSSQLEIFTALYYGLYSDTNSFSEMRHPLDRDLSGFMQANWGIIKKLKNSVLSIEELDIVAETLSSSRLVGGIGLLKARPCDPNILGFSSDIAQQVEQFESCVVYCNVPTGLKLSIRSTVREVMASELAAFLTRGVGSGGGNVEKAGGNISAEGVRSAAPGVTLDDFLSARVEDYQNNFDLVYCDNHNIDFASMRRFCKRPIPVGYAHIVDIFPENSQITIRTLEGDIDTVSSSDTYLMIGIMGEAYPIKKDRHRESYNPFSIFSIRNAEYEPVIIDRLTGEKKSAIPFAQACVPKGNKIIRAAELERDTKVFTSWDREKYFCGRAGDYIAASENNFGDAYIINREVFEKTYRDADS